MEAPREELQQAPREELQQAPDAVFIANLRG